ncbi:MAG TPA: isochorismatase family protein [Gaiellaceae bacterium]
MSVTGESRFPNLTLENSVLLVIDVINSCAHPDYEDAERNIHFNKIRQMVPALSAFITSYRRLGGRVILTTTVPWREPFLAENINDLYRESEEARYWSQDESGRAELFYEIPTDAATVFAKNSYDAFTNEELVATLERINARYIIVAGVFGDGCVMASICGGFSKGYRFVIAEDLIETTDDEDRQALQRFLKLRTWPLMYGATVTAREILAALSPAKVE